VHLLPFVVKATEVRCLEDLPERFHLYRVFDFSQKPRPDFLKGNLSQVCCPDPTLSTGLMMPINAQISISERGAARG
jgi:hypothetical protein